ncbi:universal stress protein [Paracoccus tegillarcae]|uniref:Universal stress protein UspA n=1 Tax=Paracoccus tegillarcae TaxID=1529068 RepID=A0A2K9F2B1_9RHOB|nr:universal stress protein [Paracoccus tegillarcae]AUH34502.1 universal stress protein UspA [Paracoccus tegillarcae]
MHDNILLPIDINQKASWQHALPAAVRQAGENGTIHLLGIVQDFGSSMVATFLPKGYEKKVLETMKANLNEFAEAHLKNLEGVNVKTHVGHGHVAETILKSAKKLGADLIVMGSHKPDELRSMLISSHANAVVRHSPVSVMVVR